MSANDSDPEDDAVSLDDVFPELGTMAPSRLVSPSPLKAPGLLSHCVSTSEDRQESDDEAGSDASRPGDIENEENQDEDPINKAPSLLSHRVSTSEEHQESDDDEAGSDASSPAGNENQVNQDEEPADKDGGDIEDPPLWIRKGIMLDVLDGLKNIRYSATTLADPEHDGESWVVQVRWAMAGYSEYVECSKCVASLVDLTLDNEDVPRMKRRSFRVAAARLVKFEEQERQPSPSPRASLRPHRQLNKRSNQAAVITQPEEEYSEDEQPPASIDHYCHLGSESESQENVSNKEPAARELLPLRNEKDSLASVDNDGDKKPAALERPLQNDNESDSIEEVCPRKRRNEETKKRRTKYLKMMPGGFSDKELERAFEKVGPPYEHNTVLKEIQRRRNRDTRSAAEVFQTEFEPFRVTIGMQIRKKFGSKLYTGTVTHKVPEKVIGDDGHLTTVWAVEYEEDENGEADGEDLEEYELRQLRYPQPSPILHKYLGRRLQFLELFGGSCVMSEQFRERGYIVASVDNAPDSNSTIKMNILDLDPQKLSFVPDFIWASLPCETFSRMSGSHHRSEVNDRTRVSKKAMEHNDLFLKMVGIMEWAKSLHPHLIVVIENPVGKLLHTPLMKDFMTKFGLSTVEIDYCALGREERKPTMLWSNNSDLCRYLSRFRCSTRCCIDRNHLGVRGNAHMYDFSVIPQPLAYVVSKWVTSKLILDDVPLKPAASPR